MYIHRIGLNASENILIQIYISFTNLPVVLVVFMLFSFTHMDYSWNRSGNINNEFFGDNLSAKHCTVAAFNQSKV